MIIYNVNKDKGVVVARFEGDDWYWYESLARMAEKIFEPSGLRPPYNMISKVVDSVQSYVGIARLHPEDVFDEETGKELAKQRLNEKFNRVKETVLSKLQDFVDEIYSDVVSRIERKY